MAFPCRILMLGLAAFLGTGNAVSRAAETTRRIGVVKDLEIDESSGLARSIRRPGWFWTHNDSGDSARLFLLDQTGDTRAVVQVRGATAVDWEDMASFEMDGKPFLIVGDFGNNRLNRDVVQLYLLEEPLIPPRDSRQELEAERVATLSFRFSDGPKNCESLGVDVPGRRLLLVGKEPGTCGAYELPLTTTGDASSTVWTAARIGTLPVSTATGMDVSPDGRQVVVVNYLGGFRYVRQDGESWAEALKRKPLIQVLPLRRTGEAVCFNDQGDRYYLSSEGAQQPLWEIVLPGLNPEPITGQ